jgi:hypothetical protein
MRVAMAHSTRRLWVAAAQCLLGRRFLWLAQQLRRFLPDFAALATMIPLRDALPPHVAPLVLSDWPAIGPFR